MLITSPDNRRVRQAVSLGARKQRDALGLYLVEGPNPVREALEQDVVLQALFFLEEDAVSQSRADELWFLWQAGCGSNGRRRSFPSRALFQKITQTQTPQGVLAIAE